MSLHSSNPESQGVPSDAILRFVQRIEKEVDSVHSFVLLRNGHVLANGWWHPYSLEFKQEIYSITKKRVKKRL